MVIEDNPTDVFLVREALRAQGLDVDLQVFEDGQAAITFVQQLDADDTLTCPSLVLLDVNLPGSVATLKEQTQKGSVRHRITSQSGTALR